MVTYNEYFRDLTTCNVLKMKDKRKIAILRNKRMKSWEYPYKSFEMEIKSCGDKFVKENTTNWKQQHDCCGILLESNLKTAQLWAFQTTGTTHFISDCHNVTISSNEH